MMSTSFDIACKKGYSALETDMIYILLHRHLLSLFPRSQHDIINGANSITVHPTAPGNEELLPVFATNILLFPMW